MRHPRIIEATRLVRIDAVTIPEQRATGPLRSLEVGALGLEVFQKTGGVRNVAGRIGAHGKFPENGKIVRERAPIPHRKPAMNLLDRLRSLRPARLDRAGVGAALLGLASLLPGCDWLR